MAKANIQFRGYALTGNCLSIYALCSAPTDASYTDPKQFSDLNITEFKPKTFQPDDVEVAITHCGVCGSDVHTLKQGWGESKLPLVVGHEIVGHATRVGDNVKGVKVGDRVGIGAHIGSCMQCRQCKDGYENYCPKGIATYVSSWAYLTRVCALCYNNVADVEM